MAVCHWKCSDIVSVILSVKVTFISALVIQTTAAAEPAGHVIEAYSVQAAAASSAWVINLTPAYCATELPLISIADYIPLSSSENSITYGNENSKLDTRISVQRLFAATEPIRGTMDMTYRDLTVKGKLRD